MKKRITTLEEENLRLKEQVAYLRKLICLSIYRHCRSYVIWNLLIDIFHGAQIFKITANKTLAAITVFLVYGNSCLFSSVPGMGAV
ncbi:hypothetical protein [Pectinatus sottacetonis]|uniref:hypothetical protein n=1 Tax=Pectinatus sottacetonis TaxID=1002795 RepID=UPI001E2EEDF6|nr:hypothetical protein [Pectinatus sottacetonis]